MQHTLDLNADMGEGFGIYSIGQDELLMNLITSANIACGAHAGDANVMDKTVKLAKKNGVSIGAHPGFFDRQGFGRRKMDMTPKEIYQIVVQQIGSLQAFCTIHQVNMRHVKPHGALYNMAVNHPEIAAAIAKAMYDVNPSLILIALAGSELLDAGRKQGLSVAAEAFADRTYQPDGKLTPRNKSNAMIEDVQDAVRQVKEMVFDHQVTTVDGTKYPVTADTICIHGDGIHAVGFARELKEALQIAGVEIKTFSPRE